MNGDENEITIGMSHILTDGEGFLQYLYLLASLYNGQTPLFHWRIAEIFRLF